MAELTVFKSRAPIMGYVFKTGKLIHFINGIYATSAKDEIEELTTECENGHPNYYIDENQKTIDSANLDPMAALRAQIREEERAKLLAATNVNRDMGSTTHSGKLEGIANSQSIAGAVVQSEAQGTALGQTVPSGSIKVAGGATATKL
jgi:hypothetical protein